MSFVQRVDWSARILLAEYIILVPLNQAADLQRQQFKQMTMMMPAVDLKATEEQKASLLSFLNSFVILKQPLKLAAENREQMKVLKKNNVALMMRLFPLVPKADIVDLLGGNTMDLSITQHFREKDVKEIIAEGQDRRKHLAKDTLKIDFVTKLKKSQSILKPPQLSFAVGAGGSFLSQFGFKGMISLQEQPTPKKQMAKKDLGSQETQIPEDQSIRKTRKRIQ